MEVTPIMSHDSRFMIPPGVAHKLARGADSNANAIVVGNRAGVIEWANDAWTRVTGYALDESISKPVLSFLRNVDVGPGIVDFVADCFRQGKVCEVEVPLTTPKGEFLWIQLRVEPLRGAGGEVSDFIAIATEITERKRVQASNAVAETDLSVLAARAAQNHGPVLGPCADLDLGLAEDLPLVLADASLIEGLIGRLICRAAVDVADGWGTVSVSTGVLGARPGPLFIGDLFQGLRGGHYAFVEVHDTGGGPSGSQRAVTTEPFLSPHFPRHAIRYATAELLLRNLGGELRLESSRADGTSVVMLLPFCGDLELDLR
jgi:PAS domain S-box-containing protein